MVKGEGDVGRFVSGIVRYRSAFGAGYRIRMLSDCVTGRHLFCLKDVEIACNYTNPMAQHRMECIRCDRKIVRDGLIYVDLESLVKYYSRCDRHKYENVLDSLARVVGRRVECMGMALESIIGIGEASGRQKAEKEIDDRLSSLLARVNSALRKADAVLNRNRVSAA